LILTGSSLFYGAISEELEERERRNITGVLAQVKISFENIAQEQERVMRSVVSSNYVNRFLSASSSQERFGYWPYVSNILSTIDFVPHVDNIMLFGRDRLLAGHVKDYALLRRLEATADLYGAPPLMGYLTIPGEDGRIQQYVYIQPVYNSTLGAGPIGRRLGLCVMYNDMSAIQKLVSEIELTHSAAVWLLDGESAPIAAGNEDSRFSTLPFLAEVPIPDLHESGQLTRTVAGEHVLMTLTEIPPMGWHLLTIVPMEEIHAEYVRILTLYGAFIACVLLLFVALLVRMIRTYMKPVDHIIRFSRAGRGEDLPAWLEKLPDNEIGDIGHIIGRMFETTIESQRELHETELARVQAELTALKIQINPHFLYNTLDCIKGLGFLTGSQEVVEIVNALSFLMRYCIQGADMVPLREEMNCVAKYLKIISLRFGDRFTFDLQFSSDVADLLIPRFILQPVVENSVYHGLEPKAGPGELRVKAERIDDRELVITVWDDGIGISDEALQKVREEMQAQAGHGNPASSDRGIGLYNVYSRIRYAYGKQSSLIIEQPDEGGTIVRLRLIAGE